MDSAKTEDFLEDNKDAIIADYLAGTDLWDLSLTYGGVGNSTLRRRLMFWGIEIRKERIMIEEPIIEKSAELPKAVSRKDLIKAAKEKGYNRWYESNGKRPLTTNEKILRRKLLNSRLAILKRRCELCGEANSDLLLFHHIDPAKKKSDLNGMVSKIMPSYYIRYEIAKCAVLCFNCHKRVHMVAYRDIFDDCKMANAGHL